MSKASSPRKRGSSSSSSSASLGTSPAAATDVSNYSSAIRYLYDRSDIERMRVVRYDDRTFKLDRIRSLLKQLGDPHEQVKSIHVAGTVGKGSTVAMIGSMLRGCGHAVGTYTSPHLVDVRERVDINGQMIGKNEFTELMKQVSVAARKLDSEPTFFELMTAVAFKYFAEQAVDFAVIEVGLGGRLDSTNVITPQISVITTIDHDHNRLLGRTLADIAREKAGILKKGVPALTFEQAPEVEKAIREVAEKTEAPLKIVNKDIEFSSRFCATPDLGPHTRVCLFSNASRFEHLPVPLPGEHQAVNCGLALAAMDLLRASGHELPEDKIAAGLATTNVPGRMTLLSERPRILVDGAHNAAAVQALMRCVGAHVPYDSMVCIFGCCADKDVGAILDRVNLGADKVIFTRALSNPRAADPDELQRMFAERSGKMSQVARTLPQALDLALRAVSREDLIVITGSFYLVGEAMKHMAEPATARGSAIPTAKGAASR
ncbi:MAG: bifunctional folylpolyglutamate synthase/dihydrofolate synthase [Phycisphaerales bacterium]|nr:bifunctional folylpolyglutamate synthase/dihydrofolate synthase [Phycisphaerales bacterium]